MPMHTLSRDLPDEPMLGRRRFVGTMTMMALFGECFRCPRAAAGRADAPTRNRLLFTSQGKTGIVNADGSGLRYFLFDKPGQATWQPGGTFPDGRRILFLSMEPRRDGPGRPFSEYYTQTPTHIWIHDLQTDSLERDLHKKPPGAIRDSGPPSGGI